MINMPFITDKTFYFHVQCKLGSLQLYHVLLSSLPPIYFNLSHFYFLLLYNYQYTNNTETTDFQVKLSIYL